MKEISAALGEKLLLLDEAEVRAYLESVREKSDPCFSLSREMPLPSAIAFPESRAQLAHLVRIAAAKGLALYTHGEELAAAASQKAIWVDLSGLKQIINLDKESLLIEVEAGFTPKELEAALAAHDLTLGYQDTLQTEYCLDHYLSGFEILAPFIKFDDVEDICVAVEFAAPHGRLAHTRVTPRSATGPGFKNLLLGGKHHLGLITAAVLKIRRLPAKRSEIAFLLRDLRQGFSVIRRLVQSGHRPNLVRLFNRKQTRDLGLQKQASRTLLYLLYEGRAELVDRNLQIAAELLGEFKAARVTPADTMSNFLTPKEQHPAFTMYLSLIWSRTDEFISRLNRLMAGRQGFHLTACRTWHEGVMLYISLSLDPEQDLNLIDVNKFYLDTVDLCRKEGVSILQVRGMKNVSPAPLPPAVSQVLRHLDIG